MRQFGWGLLLLTIVIALPASACQTCASYYDSQSLQWCKYCEENYCGFFGCTIVEFNGLEWCDSPYADDDEETCFTTEGMKKRWCGPWEILPAAGRMSANSKWKLVRARLVRDQTRLPRGSS
jgi:hypothetical protein